MGPRVAVLISGRGSNLQSLLEKEGCNIRLVCSNKGNAQGLLKAKRFGVPVKVFPKFNFHELKKELLKLRIQKIYLLGFMKLIPADFIQSWNQKIINLHPSLLPQFPGLNAIEKSFEANAAMGVSMHYVIPEMDSGQIILQSEIYSPTQKPPSLQQAEYGVAFREHFIVRKLSEKWN